MNIRMRKIVVLITVASLTFLYLYSNRILYSSADDKNISLKSLLVAAVKAAEVGGFQVVAVHEQVNFEIGSKGKTKEGINDPVTEADYRSHCAMYRSLLDTFPVLTVISEEASKDCDNIALSDLESVTTSFNTNFADEFVNVKDITVWIDPLDATKEFTENLLQYVTTMVCVAVKGRPVIGVIYKPFETKQNTSLFWAWKERGSSANLKNLPKGEEEKQPVLIVSRSHAGDVHNATKIAFGNNINIISAAGAGYKFLEVATGNATAYVHMTAIKKWDICAGTAVLTALGGTVTQLLDQQPISFKSTDPSVLSLGLLATMADHRWYLDKFSNI